MRQNSLAQEIRYREGNEEAVYGTLRRSHRAVAKACGCAGNLGTSWGPDGSREHSQDSHDLKLGHYHVSKRDPEDRGERTKDSCLKRHR